MQLKPRHAIASVAAVGAVLALSLLIGNRTSAKVPYSQFLEQVKSGQVASVTVTGANAGVPATYRLRDGRTERTVLPADYRAALAVMREKLVNVEIQAPSPTRFLVNSVPFLVLLAVWLVLFLKLRSGPRAAR